MEECRTKKLLFIYFSLNKKNYCLPSFPPLVGFFGGDMVAQKEVVIEHIPTGKMIADPLTKPIARDLFLAHFRGLGLRRV